MNSRNKLLSLGKAQSMARRRKIKRLKARVDFGNYTAPRRAVARALILSL